MTHNTASRKFPTSVLLKSTQHWSISWPKLCGCEKWNEWWLELRNYMWSVKTMFSGFFAIIFIDTPEMNMELPFFRADSWKLKFFVNNFKFSRLIGNFDSLEYFEQFWSRIIFQWSHQPSIGWPLILVGKTGHWIFKSRYLSFHNRWETRSFTCLKIKRKTWDSTESK